VIAQQGSAGAGRHPQAIATTERAADQLPEAAATSASTRREVAFGLFVCVVSRFPRRTLVDPGRLRLPEIDAEG